jgi:hypothetical protein
MLEATNKLKPTEIRVRRKGSSTVRRICVRCQLSIIHKNDAQYAAAICFRCSLEPGLTAARTPGRLATANSFGAQGTSLPVLGSSSPSLMPSTPGTGDQQREVGGLETDAMVLRWRKEANEGKRMTRSRKKTARAAKEVIEKTLVAAAKQVVGTKYAAFVDSLNTQFSSKGYLTARQYAAAKRMSAPSLLFKRKEP